MTEQARPDPDLIAGTVFDEAKADLARTYALALLGAVGDDAGAVLDELGEVLTEVVRGHPRFTELMTGPTMAVSDRDRVLVDLFEGRAMPPVVNLLRVLNRYGRLDLLAPIVVQARAEWDRKQGRRPVTVRSAVALDEGQRKDLEGRLSKLIGATPVLTAEVDPSLIAGLVVQVGDDVYDASVRTQLKRLRDRLIERKSHAQV